MRPVNIDQIVGDQTAIALERLLPVDIGRGVPLIDLGLLVEAPHVRLFAVVDMVEIGDIANVDVVPTLHAVPPEPIEMNHSASARICNSRRERVASPRLPGPFLGRVISAAAPSGPPRC